MSILLAASLVGIAALLLTRKPGAPVLMGGVEPIPSALRTFWNPFVTGPEEPWVVFSNAAFIGRPETGMRYYNAARDQRDLIWDHYTGVGEVLAVHSLDRYSAYFVGALAEAWEPLSLNDVQNNDLIFVGSP